MIKEIINNLTAEYPNIIYTSNVLGEPRITGTRFTVSEVLSAFAHYDSIDEIIDEYEGCYTKEQLRDALRFARDFLNQCQRKADALEND